jgi:hypothetical protein
MRLCRITRRPPDANPWRPGYDCLCDACKAWAESKRIDEGWRIPMPVVFSGAAQEDR